MAFHLFNTNLHTHTKRHINVHTHREEGMHTVKRGWEMLKGEMELVQEKAAVVAGTPQSSIITTKKSTNLVCV